MKRLLIIGTILCSIIVGLPAMLVIMFSSDDLQPTTPVQTAASTGTGQEQLESSTPISIAVYRTQQSRIEEVPLEEYVVGVVASEMPAAFELEALKAQALTARTFILKQMLEPSDFAMPEGAMVTDTVHHQVYKNLDQLKEEWGKDFDWRINRIREAVAQTQGQVLTYNGDPITAAFFSTSNGFTENSEDYWPNEIPYLRSVESPWDTNSPRFTSTSTISVGEFQQKLGVQLPSDGSVGQITNRTDGKRVAKVNINGKELTGRQVREKLGLDSSDFNWKRQGDQVVIETKGWGHGVGMSQYGANGMAQEGKTYREIIEHYYQGVAVSPVDPYIGQLVVKKD
ncbi:stage II sporulation protein D [Alkalihalobacterium elongatum]|uniref:stage II sporulation protein D n=1 Tax=Alkalihalobacterium elongatum TaxID=2675466 RepID=UPI001C1F976D|nr:stage II sporulation protein D [Alkalihalobacterium elongatum]